VQFLNACPVAVADGHVFAGGRTFVVALGNRPITVLGVLVVYDEHAPAH
jgi:hypothetical protein